MCESFARITAATDNNDEGHSVSAVWMRGMVGSSVNNNHRCFNTISAPLQSLHYHTATIFNTSGQGVQILKIPS